jgi:hypothetical protein
MKGRAWLGVKRTSGGAGGSLYADNSDVVACTYLACWFAELETQRVAGELMEITQA